MAAPSYASGTPPGPPAPTTTVEPTCDTHGLKAGDRCRPNPPCVKADLRHMCKPTPPSTEPPIIIILPGFDCAGLPVFPGDTPSTCPGTPGPPGQDGAPGVDGTPGADGVDGVDGQDGTPGVDGTDGTDGARGPRGRRGPAARSCTSRRIITIHLPSSFAGQRNVAVFVGSQRRLLPVRARRAIRVSFAGVSSNAGRGVAVAIWGRRLRGQRPHLTRIYTLCSKRGVGQFNVPPATNPRAAR